MSNGSEDVTMFAFCLANLMGLVTEFYKIIETGFIWCNGQTELLRYVAITDAISLIFPGFVLMLIATISSGIVYFGSDDDSSYRMLEDGGQEPDGGTGGYGSGYSSVDEVDGDMSSSVNHLPIILCFLMIFLRSPMQYLTNLFRGKDDFKKVSIPMNVDFIIHRLGEWIMLMLGESVLSLLIVDVVEDRYFYVTFFTGIMSVIVLQFLHFKSQPHHADGHAMRKSRIRGIINGILMVWYSAALIIVGVCYKMLLTEYSKEGEKEKTYNINARILASGGGGKYFEFSTEERQLRIATLFGSSLAVVFTCLDLMTLTHNTWNESMTRCRGENGNLIMKGLMIVFVTRITIIALVASTFKIVTRPEFVSLFGLGAIVAQVAIRFIGNVYFPPESHYTHPDEEGHWPNVTHGVAVEDNMNNDDEKESHDGDQMEDCGAVNDIAAASSSGYKNIKFDRKGHQES